MLTSRGDCAEDTFLYALSSNNAWAGYKAHQNPSFFSKLASGQTPQIRKSDRSSTLSVRPASHALFRPRCGLG